MTARTPSPALPPPTPVDPPRFVHDERGETVGVILSYEDYKSYVRLVAAYADWEALPPYLQDAVDRLLAEEAAAEGEARPLRDLLREGGEEP